MSILLIGVSTIPHLEDFHSHKTEFTGNKSIRFHMVLYNQPF